MPGDVQSESPSTARAAFSSPTTSAMRSGASAVRNRVFQYADLVDLDLHLVAGLHPDRRRAPRADAAGSAGDQHVAGLKRRPGRAVLDDLRDLEDHLLGSGVLHPLAVEAAGERHLG